MRTMTRGVSVVTIMAGLALACGDAYAEVKYTVIDLGFGYAEDINSVGEVVGYSGSTFHAFLYSGGQITDLGTLGTMKSRAWGINDNGDVVGDSDGRAFLYSKGEMTAVFGDVPGIAYDINNAGQIAGMSGGNPFAIRYTNSTTEGIVASHWGARGINESGQVVGSTFPGAVQGFCYSDQGTVWLDPLLPNEATWAYDINDSGQITGGSAGHAFLYCDGNMTDLGTLGGTYSSGYGINSLGQVVGDSDTILGINSNHAFLYSDGIMTDLNSVIDPASGWTLKVARAINDSGQIVGWGYYSEQTGGQRAYLLNPVPEPASLSLVLIGGLALLRRRL